MTDQAISCNIKAIKVDESERHFDLVSQWQNGVEEVMVLPTGYAFRFAPETVNLTELAEFVSRERLCCPFFHFEIAAEANDGPISLHLMGGKEVKSFVRESLLGE